MENIRGSDDAKTTAIKSLSSTSNKYAYLATHFHCHSATRLSFHDNLRPLFLNRVLEIIEEVCAADIFIVRLLF